MLLAPQLSTTGHSPVPGSTERLAAIASSGFLGVGVPGRWGGCGGELNNLFHDSAARQWLRALDDPDQLMFCSQRLAVEALLQSNNVGLRELLLPDLLSGEMGGASAVECPCLEASPRGQGWQFNGRLTGVPNLQWNGFSLLLPVQIGGQVEGLLMVRSEENGVTVQPSEPYELWRQAGCGTVSLHKVFVRADEWLGNQQLWAAIATTNRALRNGLSAINRR